MSDRLASDAIAVPTVTGAKMDRFAVLEVVFQAIDVINGLRTEDEQVPRTPDAVLAGPGGALDSLALVTLILNVESRVEGATGVEIGLLDDGDFGDDLERIRTPEAITELVLNQLPQ